jgi:N-acetyl-1-D-myo-inositol-2-amino-2-deoxy-alpha-D-glucopyranoside deacetylase
MGYVTFIDGKPLILVRMENEFEFHPEALSDSVDDLPFAKDDKFVTTLIDGGNYVQHKLDAMKAHETQISTDGPFFALSNNLGLQIWGDEYYTLVLGDKAEPFNDQGRETDLFAGVNL